MNKPVQDKGTTAKPDYLFQKVLAVASLSLFVWNIVLFALCNFSDFFYLSVSAIGVVFLFVDIQLYRWERNKFQQHVNFKIRRKSVE